MPGKTLCNAHAEKWKISAQSRKLSIAAYKRSIRDRENARKKTPDYRAKINRWRREKKRIDPIWAITDRLRKRIGRAVRDQLGSGRKKAFRTEQLIGCTVSQLMAHLESQFQPGMSWENRSLWHIDHKRPCASFDLAEPEQQKACFHYTNLQPLWAKDNLEKHTKFVNN